MRAYILVIHTNMLSDCANVGCMETINQYGDKLGHKINFGNFIFNWWYDGVIINKNLMKNKVILFTIN